MRLSRYLIIPAFVLLTVSSTGSAALVIDKSDPDFARLVQAEIDAMAAGTRGIAAKSLMERLEIASATTTVKQLGSDESTWHPNDHRGTRSHVVPGDTRMRGAERRKPTSAILYLHKTRIDPGFSLFKLGTFIHELSFAADLNDGKFSADFKTREKRATFYRNGWLDSFGLKPILISDRVSTPDYPRAKELGLITAENTRLFPILDPVPLAVPSPDPTSTP